MRSIPPVLMIGCLLLSACTLEPSYRRPAASVPPRFPTGPAYAHTDEAAASAPGWREVFVEPKLRRVIEMALANNRDLRVAVAQIEAAQAQYHVQRASLLPSVSASGSASYAHSYTGLPPSLGGAYASTTDYAVSAGVTSYELDLFGRVRSLTKAALETYLATTEARRSTEISLIAEVATDWFTMASDESLLDISKSTAESGTATLDLAQRRLTGGVGSALDVSNAVTIVEQARADVAKYTALVAQDRNALDLAVGAPVPGEDLPTGINDPATRLPTIPNALDSGLLLQRPDVVEAEHTLRAYNANIGAARAAFFPKITLAGSGGSTTGEFSRLFGAGTGVWAFTPSISLPIFDGGANRANLAYSRAEHQIAIAKYEKAIQTAFRESADALADRGMIGERERALRALVAAAADSLRLSQGLYQVGSDSYLDVLIARRTLYSAQQGLVAVQLIDANNIVTLYKVLGGGVTDAAPH